jgi:hypothetical protein
MSSSTGELPVLSDGEVTAFLTEHCGAAGASMFPMRIAPEDGQPHPGKDKVFRTPVQVYGHAAGAEQYVVISWSFGQPSDDEMLNWRPVWRKLEGPMTRAELDASS